MKKILIILAITLTYSCGTYQTFKAADLTKEVVSEDLNKSQTDLYITANDWMVDIFKNAEGVTQFSDKETGTIIGKYLLSGNNGTVLGTYVDTRIFAKISIQVKENRTKIVIAPETDITATDYSKIAEIRNSINNLATNFNNRIQNTNKNEW